MPFCPKCQYLNPDSAKFCQQCSSILSSAAAPAPPVTTTQAPTAAEPPIPMQPHSRRKLTTIIAGVAILTAIILIASVLSVPTTLHPTVTVSGSLTMRSGQTPNQITFTDVNDIANSASVSISGSSYSVTVQNGHSYNIRIDYSYASQYQYECDAYQYFSGSCGQGDYCSYDGIGYACTHSETLNGVCSGGPLKVNVSGNAMNFDVQCS